MADKTIRHIAYRQYILACKRKWGSARSLVKYKALIKAYLDAKREFLRG